MKTNLSPKYLSFGLVFQNSLGQTFLEKRKWGVWRVSLKIHVCLCLGLLSEMAMCQKEETRGTEHRREPGFMIPLFGEWVTVQSANCSPSSLFTYLR